MTEPEPFEISIPQAELDDLERRLTIVRWPAAGTASGWAQGVPLNDLQALVEYWRSQYDWRRCERMLNKFSPYKVSIDGIEIAFFHIRSPHTDALPLIMTHGWPGSVVEFHKVVAPLVDPISHGGSDEQAFHVILPCLPGFGFSERPTETGWGVERIARAWSILMTRLGYPRYVAQGGDWGSSVTAALGALAPQGLRGIHLNLPFVVPRGAGKGTLSEAEAQALASLNHYNSDGAGYAQIQRTRPQTIGYGLTDSPVGQAAWIYEKFFEWTDNGGLPETVLTRDEMLDNIMLYWLTGTAVSSGQLYWETFGTGMRPARIDLPVGCSIFPKDIYRAPRSWADKTFSNIVYWNEPAVGGHFAAFEQPAIFVDELRQCFSRMR